MRSMKPDKDILVSTIRIPPAGGSIPALVLSPKGGAQTAAGILWIHGGGYITGMKEMVHMSRAVDLVKRFGAVVVSPGYRLAIQRPFPAAVKGTGVPLCRSRKGAGLFRSASGLYVRWRRRTLLHGNALLY